MPPSPSRGPHSPSGDYVAHDDIQPFLEPRHGPRPDTPIPDLSYDNIEPSSTTNFLDNVLNPAQLDHGRYSPFTHRPSEPDLWSAYTHSHALMGEPYTPQYRPQPYQPIHWPDLAEPPSMAMSPHSNTHHVHTRSSARLSNGYVDLTFTSDSPSSRRKRESPEEGPSSKRQKRQDDTARPTSRDEPITADEVDLTDEKPSMHSSLHKQREDAVKARTRPQEQPTNFNTFTCVICMDNPNDLTATSCGHLFCYTCLMEALIAGENRTRPGETRRSQCPVCRKAISRTKASDIVPLLLMKGLSTQSRKSTKSTTAGT